MNGQIMQFGRPTTYKGIEMRSRLEAKVAAWFDHTGRDWEYEPRAFADERGQYLPDFVIQYDKPRPHTTYLEIKGKIQDEAHRRQIQERMEIVWSSDPGGILELWEGFPLRGRWLAAPSTGWWTAVGPEVQREKWRGFDQ